VATQSARVKVAMKRYQGVHWSIDIDQQPRGELFKRGHGPVPYRPDPVHSRAVISTAGAGTLPSRLRALAFHDSPLDVERTAKKSINKFGKELI
jgi:hypothetical protein